MRHMPAVALLGSHQVGNNTLAQAVTESRPEAYFYRTAAGAEIDLLLKLSSKDLWAIEIKNGVAPKIKKGFYIACDDVKASRKYIVYGGDDEFPIEKETVMISLKNILMKLQDTNKDSS